MGLLNRLTAFALVWVLALSTATAFEIPTPKPRIYRPDDPIYSSFGPFLVASYQPDAIFLAGDISSDAPLEFLRALRKFPNINLLVLSSYGGLVDPALLVAHQVRDRGISTYVPEGYDCFSACAYIYFAGAKRRADGRLGVHQVWNDTNDAVASQATFSDVFETMRDFGVADEIISLMLRTPPDQMHIFAGPELAALEVNRGDIFAEEERVAERGDEERLTPEPPKSDPNGVVVTTSPGRRTTIAEQHSPTSPDPATIEGSQSLLLEASDDGTTGAVPFAGTVAWSRGWDDAGYPTLIGEAEIPARQMRLSALIRKNSDPSLPASHLMEFEFAFSGQFVGGAIAGLPGVLFKDEALVQGTPLVGASSRVVGNSFLFALSARPADFINNVALLRTRRWMDLAVVYATGKRAIVTPEKDDAAVALFNEVFEAWKVDKQKDDGVPQLQPGFNLNFESPAAAF